MWFKEGQIWAIVIITSITLFGLGWLQWQWMHWSLEMEQQQVNRQLGILLPEINSHFFLDPELKKLDDKLKNELKSEQRTQIISRVEAALSHILQKYALPAKPQFWLAFGNSAAIIDNASFQPIPNATESTCLSCSLQFVFGEDLEEDSNNEEQEIPNAKGSIMERPVEEMTRLLGKPEEELLFLHLKIDTSINWSNPQSAFRLALAFLFLTTLLAVFAFILKTLSKQKKLNAIKDDFINSLTHELKTPIGSILLASKVLRKHPKGEQQHIYLDLIEQEGKRLESQIDKFLQLALVDTGNFELDLAYVDVREIIKNSSSRLRLLALKKNANVHLELPQAPVFIALDELHFTNVLTNLIENAIKYNKGEAAIKISLINFDKIVRIQVQDNGIGIPINQQASIFDKFYRVAESDTQGFGLGLSYVKKVVEEHGGTIRLESQPQKGSNFIIELPKMLQDENNVN